MQNGINPSIEHGKSQGTNAMTLHVGFGLNFDFAATEIKTFCASENKIDAENRNFVDYEANDYDSNNAANKVFEEDEEQVNNATGNEDKGWGACNMTFSFIINFIKAFFLNQKPATI